MTKVISSHHKKHKHFNSTGGHLRKQQIKESLKKLKKDRSKFKNHELETFRIELHRAILMRREEVEYRSFVSSGRSRPEVHGARDCGIH